MFAATGFCNSITQPFIVQLRQSRVCHSIRYLVFHSVVVQTNIPDYHGIVASFYPCVRGQMSCSRRATDGIEVNMSMFDLELTSILQVSSTR
jgi:hypothetical protein